MMGQEEALNQMGYNKPIWDTGVFLKKKEKDFKLVSWPLVHSHKI
jgi:hypothetical protein